MRQARFSSVVTSALVFVAALIFAIKLLASIHTGLYSFTGGTDGNRPLGALIFDKAGNLYGTTSPNGNGVGSCSPGGGCGTIFELKPSNGGWIETTLYDFCSLPNCADGASPQSGLVFDNAGNLYGTTLMGGNTGCGSAFGCGVVFELSPTGSGWTETVLYSFNGGTDGAWPYSGVIFDNAGNLYGTTLRGGGAVNASRCPGCGTVFKLTPSSGSWTETLLHSFPANSTDGYYPMGNLAFDANGNLYGTTNGGGASQNYGAVYQLSPVSGGWTETIIHSFNIVDGTYPDAGLILGSDGNLYGTATGGGSSTNGGGVVFELTNSNGRLVKMFIPCIHAASRS